MATRRAGVPGQYGSPSTRIVPASGRSRPTSPFSTVLLPLPLPPISAKIEPARMRRLDVLLHHRAAIAERQPAGLDLEALRSQPEPVRQHGEHRVHRDDADDARHHRPRRRLADRGGAAPGTEPDMWHDTSPISSANAPLLTAPNANCSSGTARASAAANAPGAMPSMPTATSPPPIMPIRQA